MNTQAFGALVALLLAWAAPACAHEAADQVAALAADPADAGIGAHLGALRETFDQRVVEALDRVEGLGPRLLAARAYLRNRANIAERWSWSDEDIARYEGSALQRALDDEVARVRATFEADNPGYTLWVNPQVRSLEVQLERWNSNESVAAAAQTLLQAVRDAARTANTPVAGSDSALEWFEGVLRDHVPQPTPTLAAPGLSAHGRMSAVDFHVLQGESSVAAPDAQQVTEVWRAQGWHTRLEAAVRSASRRFEGPLLVPDEPWHYEYRQSAGVAATR
jgi:hypothetical protein